MTSGPEVAEEYRATLADLTNNNKTQINLLTILADDYSSFSAHIVKTIEEFLMECPKPLKIVVLYVVDSIAKNVPKEGDYRAHFAKSIVNMFVHVFQESDEKARGALHRLRSTWACIFPKGKLYAIDTKINALDKAWPVQSPSMPAASASSSSSAAAAPAESSSQQQLVHVNPKFFNKQTAATSAADGAPLKSALKRTTPAGGGAAAPTLAAEAKKLRIAVPQQQQQKGANGAAKRSVEIIEAAPAASPKKAAPTAAAVKKPRSSGKADKARAPATPPKRDARPKQPVEVKKEPAGHSPPAAAPPKSIFDELHMGGEDSPTEKRPLVQPIAPLPPPQGRIPLIGARQQPQREHERRPSPAPHYRQPAPPTGPFQPTASLGSHAFNMSAPPLAAPALLPLPLPLLHAPQEPFGGFPTPQPQPQALQYPLGAAAPPLIRNETPRLPGVPANNRIFVDGKAYEVNYLDDVAIIERNGLPHRVSFSGPPHDVIIDGVAHLMAFGESKPVAIDGETHILRFGAPSRELYMGNFPFKGAFGGPPIVATINGRRHEIRLCGPPPEVKIEQDPCYELARYMQGVRPATQMQQPQPAAPPPQPKRDTTSMDVAKFLQKLSHTGVLNTVLAEAAESSKRSENVSASRGKRAGRSSPPIPCGYRLENVERRAAPATALEFSMHSLIVRYDTVVDALHRPRTVCSQCGIALSELYGTAAQRHRDWHLQDMIEQKNNKYKRFTPWFMADEWLVYSETENVNKLQSAAEAGKDEQQAAAGASGGAADALSADTDLKECCVCREPFEEYFDDDEDVWKLRDCIVEGGKAFHRYCQSDVTNTSMPLDISAAATADAADAKRIGEVKAAHRQAAPVESPANEPSAPAAHSVFVKGILAMVTGGGAAPQQAAEEPAH